MKQLLISISVETKKLYHSKVPFITFLAMLLIPFMGGFFMYILKDPVNAQRLGIISSKAQLATGGTADWVTYLGLLSQAISLGGIFIFGFLTSWVFGREYSDRTIKDLLALPISREDIVYSKYIVIFLWSLILSIMVFVIGLIVGYVVHIPGYNSDTINRGILTYFSCALLTILLSTPVGLFACIGKGYLSPLGFLVFVLILAQMIAATGYGVYFPWSIPALHSGISDASENTLMPGSLIIVCLTSLLGLSGTALWWRYKDHN